MRSRYKSSSRSRRCGPCRYMLRHLQTLIEAGSSAPWSGIGASINTAEYNWRSHPPLHGGPSHHLLPCTACASSAGDRQRKSKDITQRMLAAVYRPPQEPIRRQLARSIIAQDRRRRAAWRHQCSRACKSISRRDVPDQAARSTADDHLALRRPLLPARRCARLWEAPTSRRSSASCLINHFSPAVHPGRPVAG